MTKTLGLISVFVTVFLTLALCRPPRASGDASTITLRLKSADGKTYDISSMRGQVVVVSYGATWCKPCVAELEALEELKREFQNSPVKFLWVSIESETEKSDAQLREYAKSLKLTIPVLRDPEKKSYHQFTARVRMPLVVFYDKAGSFVPPVHVGMGTPDLYKARIRERVNPLLAK